MQTRFRLLCPVHHIQHNTPLLVPCLPGSKYVDTHYRVQRGPMKNKNQFRTRTSTDPFRRSGRVLPHTAPSLTAPEKIHLVCVGCAQLLRHLASHTCNEQAISCLPMRERTSRPTAAKGHSNIPTYFFLCGGARMLRSCVDTHRPCINDRQGSVHERGKQQQEKKSNLPDITP